eukprot:12909704-Prorocentrum_lima.AAC.1
MRVVLGASQQWPTGSYGRHAWPKHQLLHVVHVGHRMGRLLGTLCGRIGVQHNRCKAPPDVPLALFGDEDG